MPRIALVTGATGMDGSLLSELLLEKGYEVHALVRQSTQFTRDTWGNLSKIMRSHDERFVVHHGDMTDSMGMRVLIDKVAPDEVYNLAAQSHVGLSFELPEGTADVTALGALRLLDAIRQSGGRAKFLQAGSSEMFGKVCETPQNEDTRFYPRSPYGVAKVYAHHMTKNYRESYAMFAVSSICFNHEHPRRGENFVTRKITRAVGRIRAGSQDRLVLGNTDAKRDWGYAPDYVRAMWLMLQRDEPEDFVIGTGETHSVQEFLEASFARAGLLCDDFVERDARFMRPTEVDHLCADPTRARVVLGWEPTVRFDRLVQIMTDHDIELAERERLLEIDR